MRDPLEGIAADGTIRTGASTDSIPHAFTPIIEAARSEFVRQHPDAELLLYGSVATGQAVPGSSDVDFIAVGVDDRDVAELAATLSAQFSGMCRGVEIASTSTSAHLGDDDEAYGNRVFLRHYCVPIVGPDLLRGTRRFAADAHAARGFNGDIGLSLERWRREQPGPKLARRIARKTLLALAGILSVRERIWTTDRGTAVDWYSGERPELAPSLTLLDMWSRDATSAQEFQVREVLADQGIVATIVADFERTIGLWGSAGDAGHG